MPRTQARQELASKLVVFSGMPRTASTSLFHILADHPAVFRPFRKEMGYFLFNHHKGERWYIDAYRDARDDQRCIDVTPEYFFDRNALERMRTFDVAQVVIGVRSPSAFAMSLHAEYAKRYRVPPLEDFVEHWAYRRGSALIEFRLTSGTISTMLTAFASTFGARLMLYDFSAFQRDPLSILQTFERFASLPPYFNGTTFRSVHANRGDRRTTRWLSALLSAEPLIDAAAGVAPARVLRGIAKIVYGAEQYDTPRTHAPSPPTPMWLMDKLAPDEESIRRLFRGRAVIDGTGTTLQE
jgi:hypothetical protein